MPDSRLKKPEHRWDNLLVWLRDHGMKSDLLVERRKTPGAGHGLFALKSCPPSTPLFTIPATALMNIKTLKTTYFTRGSPESLTAIQLMSLHLSLYRPQGEEDSPDPLFGPYISTLPRDFDSHPLTWLVKRIQNMAPRGDVNLLQCLPPCVHDALQKLHTRFQEDWAAVTQFMHANPIATPARLVNRISPDDSDSLMDFVWAWLTGNQHTAPVNTRCIYHRLKASKSDPDNVTMCPILDFANHTSELPHMTPVPSHADIWNVAPVSKYGDSFSFLSPGGIFVQEGEQLYLTYGAHSNRTLFVEYGFVNHVTDDSILQGGCQGVQGNIDLQDMVEPLIRPEDPLGSLVKSALMEEGYWGDWTLHSSPKPAHPSYRLMTALRLHHLVAACGSARDDVLQPWRDVIAGQRDTISDVNENDWRQTLVTVCDAVIERAEPHIGAKSEWSNVSAEEEAWLPWMRGNIAMLWKEERLVAIAVKASVLHGEEF
ncbi:SET domain-containing protein [Leucogyrophana mollusca]|uniref:SET domain-containing protein n=1 Tax=Leucogyrophana mollusca TaxID=85980 RepID=A0ACB8C1I7_9AGAM|nr:SET domain-containing protein [Leucogyrophana mollusca]